MTMMIKRNKQTAGKRKTNGSTMKPKRLSRLKNLFKK